MKGAGLVVNQIKQFLEASYDKNPPSKIGEFQLDTQLTNEYVKVYFSISKRKVVIIHRGTGSLPDWRFNLVYGINSNAYNLTSRYKNSKNIQKKTQEKYRGYKIETLGHSQGALLAHKLGEKSHSIIELNPAYKGERQLKNEYIIRSSLDPVSALKAPINSINKVLYPSYTRKHNITIPAKTMNPLTEHSIDNLNRLPQDEFIGTAGSFYKKNKKYIIESQFPFD